MEESVRADRRRRRGEGSGQVPGFRFQVRETEIGVRLAPSGWRLRWLTSSRGRGSLGGYAAGRGADDVIPVVG